MEVLYGFLSSLAMLAPIFLFGFLIAVLNRRFYRLAGKYGKKVCYATGVIGTPIHELAHASMCLLFGHKIQEIKLFQIDSNDGTLGYVRHSYNKKNIYHRIGNFFIGIAPIVVGSLFLILLMFLTVGPMFSEIADRIGVFGGLATGETAADAAAWEFLKIFGTFFTYAGNFWWWIYLLIAAAVALHMNLSKADIAGSKEGLAVFVIFLFLVSLILGLVSESVSQAVRSVYLQIAIYLSLILFLSVFLSLLWILLALLFRLPGAIKKSSQKNKRQRAAAGRTGEVNKTRERKQPEESVPNKDDPKYIRKTKKN